MSLTTDQRLLIEANVQGQRKSMGAAYALWAFLGLISMHRFYLEKPGTAILQIILNCLLVGILWTLIDAFLIPGMIREHEAKLRAKYYGVVAPAEMFPAVDMSRWSEKDKASYARKQAGSVL